MLMIGWEDWILKSYITCHKLLTWPSTSLRQSYYSKRQCHSNYCHLLWWKYTEQPTPPATRSTVPTWLPTQPPKHSINSYSTRPIIHLPGLHHTTLTQWQQVNSLPFLHWRNTGSIYMPLGPTVRVIVINEIWNLNTEISVCDHV